jgi:type III restriction enzyme
MLVLETKGQDTEQDEVKRRYLAEWVEAVNSHGGFGRWHWAVARQPGDIRDILAVTTPVVARG